MLCRTPALPTISAGQRANDVSARRGQGQGRTADLPLRRSITLSALTWKSSNSPVHAHPRCSPAVLGTFNTHNKCTGVCRFVRGISVGISPRVADLWGFCRARRSPDLPGRPGPRASRYRNFCVLVIILRVTQRGRDSLPARGGSAPANSARQTDGTIALVGACRSLSYGLVGWSAHDAGRADGRQRRHPSSAFYPIGRRTPGGPHPRTPRLAPDTVASAVTTT